jgi:hypothetical protein
MKKYQNIHTSIHTSSNKPYRYKVLSVVQETDKGEVGDSSSPRPTIGLRSMNMMNPYLVGVSSLKKRAEKKEKKKK